MRFDWSRDYLAPFLKNRQLALLRRNLPIAFGRPYNVLATKSVLGANVNEAGTTNNIYEY
ncbi:hypothetical protein GCM10009000_050790 [Halobacterium noricense]